MILQKRSTGVVAIKQVDHAQFAAFLLEHWSDHRFPDHPNREKILLATRDHDNGWKKFDENPRIDGRTKLPVDFMHVNAEEAHAVWTRSADAYRASEPLVTLLIIHHAYSIHEIAHRRDSSWKQFFIDFAQRRANLRDELGLTHNEVEHVYSFFRMTDWFSLAYCSRVKLGVDRPSRYAGYNIRREGNEFLFRPYPFDARILHYTLPVYPLQKGGYAGEKELKKALKTPQYEEIEIRSLERFV